MAADVQQVHGEMRGINPVIAQTVAAGTLQRELGVNLQISQLTLGRGNGVLCTSPTDRGRLQSSALLFYQIVTVAAAPRGPTIEWRQEMKSRQFGSPPRPVSEIGQGTWNIEHVATGTAVQALRRGIDLGMTHIDTAEMYGSGKAEQLIATAIDGRRREIFLVSKVLPSNASRKGVVQACEASLARLQTDRLDCYLLHWRGSYPLRETVAAFEQLIRDGKILSWGVSNFDVDDLEEIYGLSSSYPPVCNQVLYHLEERAIEHSVIPWCSTHGMAVVAYSPFGSESGFPAPRSPGGRVLQQIADVHGATPRQVALRFLLRNPSVFAIPKASTPEHVADNAQAGALELSSAELEKIDAAFPRGPRPRSLPMI